MSDRRSSPSRTFRWLLALALVPEIAAAGLAVQYVGRAEGLPSTQVHAVIEASDGFMWFAGPSGLARYDGWRMVSFGKADGLTSQGLRSLGLDREGRLWLGTDAGVDVRHTDGRIHPLEADGGWRYGFVDAIAADPAGTMWIAAARGLLSWSEADGLRAVQDPRFVDRQVPSVAVDTGGRVWAAVPSVGLLRLDGESWTLVEPPGLEHAGTVRTLTPSTSGAVLVGGDEGLVEIDASGSAALPIGAAQGPGLVSAVMELGEELWLGRGGELLLYRRQAGRFRLAEVIPDTGLINDFAVDRLGNLWAATDRVGVVKISALRHAVRPAQTPCGAQVFAIAREPESGYLIGGDRCSWVSSEDGTVQRRLEELDRVKVWDILRDRRGTLWAATENGLYRGREDRPMAPAELVSETLSAPGRVLLERGETLWVGTVTGLVEVAGEQVRVRLDDAGQPLGYVYTLEADPEGRLWAGTIGNGLWRERMDGELERVAGPELTETGNAYSIAFGARGRVVVAQDDRLVVLEGGGSTRLPSATGDAVAAWSLLASGDGRLWAGGTSGLIRYDLDAGAAALRLTSTMGLTGEEFTSSRSLALARDGRLLCGLDGGLTLVDPGELARLNEPPRAHLMDVEWSNAELDPGMAQVVVREGRWTLDAVVAAPWFLDERSLSYRHRVRGFDARWSVPRAGSEHQIHYTGLPAGSYVLQAQAHSPLVGWGPAVELLSFRVAPPWWRRPWARAAAFILVLAGASGLWRWRTRSLFDRGRELERQVEKRTEELRQALERQRYYAAHDELTGLPNQRTFWEQAQRHHALAARNETDLSLVVLDLDRFKQINDTHGHRAGDRVLADVARFLLKVGRDSDLLARYGGEEFVVLMPETSEPEAVRAAERLRASLANALFGLLSGAELRVTASFGVSCLQGPDDNVEALFRRADAAVYRAKETKNAVAVWQPEPEG